MQQVKRLGSIWPDSTPVVVEAASNWSGRAWWVSRDFQAVIGTVMASRIDSPSNFVNPIAIMCVKSHG
ncbi:unnamed protein product [Rodentolepis nana]|uniref:Transposase n=1 Tax=Rodentolepis nana TaxID=102285 RepID=A0A0R3TD55_RODNA|nr:unnamed protein product [Rodentolepis nana]